VGGRVAALVGAAMMAKRTPRRSLNIALAQAKKKVREARYFHGGMVHAEQTVQKDAEVFEFLLSAFLSATTSVVEQLKARGAAYSEWRDGLTPAEKAVVNEMTEERGAAVHRIGTSQRPARDQIPASQPFSRTVPAMMRSSVPPGTPESTVVVRHYYKINGVDHLATDIGQQYLQLLERLIERAQVKT
jgi:hypothetical protein